MSNPKCECCNATMVEGYIPSWDGSLIYHSVSCTETECAKPSEIILSITKNEVEY